MMNGRFNPDPIRFEEIDELENDFLSSSRLQEISGFQDLNQVHTIKIEVNTKETTLGNFGKYLPSLKQLTLNNSFIPSIRDIGTSFHQLTTLVLSKCHLSDVDGIATIQNLVKLDISCNNVNDISPVSFLDELKEFDASENFIAEIEQIDYLSLVPELVNLNVLGNPLCHSFADTRLFRDHVLSKLPNLQKLNNEDCSKTPVQSSSDASSQSTVVEVNNEQDASFIRNKPHVTDFKEPTLRSSSIAPKRPLSSSSQTRQGFLSRSVDFSVVPSRPGSSGSNEGLGSNDDTSMLTFGSLFYGNPLHAIKDRKTAPPSPLIAKLSQEPDSAKRPRPRPATAIVLRRSVKAISDDQLQVLKTDLKKAKISKNMHLQEIPDSNNNFELRSPRPPQSKMVCVSIVSLFNMVKVFDS